jgi:serine/threonine protein kinase
MGGRTSIEGDVYSYSILLLEMFTGVSPTDERFDDSLSIQKHVDMVFSEKKIMDIIDTKLLSGIDGQDKHVAPKNVYSCS